MNLITFDIEEHYHLLDLETAPIDHGYSLVERVTENILELLDKSNVKAIFFIIGEVAHRYPKLVLEISNRGHVIGSHSMQHKLHSELTDEMFIRDLEDSLDIIEAITGRRPTFYRAPGFSLTKAYFHRYKLLHNLGIKYDSSLFLGSASHGGVSESDVKKFQVKNTYRIDGVTVLPFRKSSMFGLKLPMLGGGYFRLMPWCLIRYALKKNQSVTYFHPRDFDAQQPKISGLSLVRCFKSYVGLKGSFTKLEKLVFQGDWLDPNSLDVLEDK